MDYFSASQVGNMMVTRYAWTPANIQEGDKVVYVKDGETKITTVKSIRFNTANWNQYIIAVEGVAASIYVNAKTFEGAAYVGDKSKIMKYSETAIPMAEYMDSVSQAVEIGVGA